MAPSLSVIIPTYNRAAWLPKCVRSVQDCGPDDVEIIIVDDGSTDETEQVIATLPGVVLLRQRNQGPAAARNYGFRQSHGRYLAFLDSDDQWLPEAPRRAVELLDRLPEIDLLFTDARMGNPEEGFHSWIESAGQNEFFCIPCREPVAGLRIFDAGPLFRRMAERNPVFIGAAIMRRQAFERAGCFDAELWGAADWELWLRMASRMTFAYWPEAVAVYTRHRGSMSQDLDQMGAEFCLALKKVLAKCVWLAPHERRWIRQRLRYNQFGHAYRAYDRGDYGEARRRFARLLRESGFHGRGLAYWLLCALPARATSRLRKWKQVLFS